MVGLFVGRGVGARVGRLVGRTVGAGVGRFVGSTEGVLVGFGVGSFDGLGVVGCRVGCRVVGRRVVVGLDISAVSLVSTTITE